MKEPATSVRLANHIFSVMRIRLSGSRRSGLKGLVNSLSSGNR
jgi:hypothetical protein